MQSSVARVRLHQPYSEFPCEVHHEATLETQPNRAHGTTLSLVTLSPRRTPGPKFCERCDVANLDPGSGNCPVYPELVEGPG